MKYLRWLIKDAATLVALATFVASVTLWASILSNR